MYDEPLEDRLRNEESTYRYIATNTSLSSLIYFLYLVDDEVRRQQETMEQNPERFIRGCYSYDYLDALLIREKLIKRVQELHQKETSYEQNATE